jgi:hypothetical protein
MKHFIRSPFLIPNENEVLRWKIICDNNSGKKSSGHTYYSEADEALVLHGNISVSNNAGFILFKRHSPPWDPSPEFIGVWLQVFFEENKLNDWQLLIETTASQGHYAFQADINSVPGKWCDIFLPFEGFLPVRRGQILENLPCPDPEKISSFALKTTCRQNESFRFFIRFVGGYATMTEEKR